MQITLTVTDGPHQGKVFTFSGHDTFLVGRSKHVHFQLRAIDKWFSRIHFMVEVNPPLCRLMDMGSRNGTRVNDAVVVNADLKDGDVIKAGHTVMRVAIQDSPAPAADLAAPFPLLLRPVQPPPLPPARAQRPVAPALPPPLPPIPKAVPPTLPAQGDRRIDAQCVVCALPVLSVPRQAAPSDNSPGPWPLCLSCRTAIMGQPQPIPGYLLIRTLGEGGMGIVHLALRKEDGHLAAVKTIRPAVRGTDVQIERFLREARILEQLQHPNIVALREIGKAGETLFFAMDYVAGSDAAQLLKRTGPLSIKHAVELVVQLLAALAYAHAKGFVHRDIKPRNLLLCQETDRPIVRLADFGLARVYQASEISGITMLGTVGGTLPFMAPEQITHFRDSKPFVDQYAAGSTLYNLLTDKFPFDFPRDPNKQFLMIMQEQPIPILQRRRDLPRQLAESIHRSLAKKPTERFASATVMRQALLKFCQ